MFGFINRIYMINNITDFYQWCEGMEKGAGKMIVAINNSRN